jgi:hypothetical protein
MTPLAAGWLALALAARSAPALPLPAAERASDGLEVIVQPMPGALRASLRVLVRAGGARDPAAKAGLAHFVEHLVMQGSADVRFPEFDADARAAGAVVNAHTTQDWTKYELDAPAAAFPALAERMLRMTTSPDWNRCRIGTERGVIETEAEYHAREGLLTLVDWAVFPSPAQGGPLVGTETSRAGLELDDAIAFFQAHYVPANTTIVLTGAVSPEAGRALVARAYRVPPSLPGEWKPVPADPPSLPIQQKVSAPVTVMMLGYALAPQDRALCEEVAALLQLRIQRVLLPQGNVRAVEVDCPRLRGNPFILALAYTNRLDSGDLEKDLDEAFASVASRPPDARERALVDARLTRARDWIVAEPDRLAEAIAVRAAADGGHTDVSAVFPGRLPAALRLSELARRSFSRANRVQLGFSPLQE